MGDIHEAMEETTLVERKREDAVHDHEQEPGERVTKADGEGGK
jgi:hypothetical protein